MTPELIYFIKINTALIVFYAFYRLFFYKDTFFHLRRLALLLFFALGFLYPLFNLHDWVKQQESIADVILIYSAIFPETIVEVESSQETFSWQMYIPWIWRIVYGTGVFLLFSRFLIQLSSIFRIRLRSSFKIIEGVKVYVLTKPAGPFSFFRWIFVHPESHSEGEKKEILTHELTHVTQWHSVDVLISEFICIICWFNPFVWLLKREVRHNLEYLADNTVLRLGYDSRSYQYHLLGLAHHSSVRTIYNSFNVLDLKNRIYMMNKERSGSLGRTKYFLFIPLTALLMVISNIESFARTARELTGTILPVNREALISVKGLIRNTDGNPLSGTAVLSKDGKIFTVSEADGRFALTNVPANTTFSFMRPGMARKEFTLTENTEDFSVVLANALNMRNNPVFNVVEEMPQFPGGEIAMLTYISQSIRYPEEAQENGKQGRVIVTFIVNEDGSISDTNVIRGLDPLLDREAERVVNIMPKWKPGKQGGKDVAVRYTLPITYRLQ